MVLLAVLMPAFAYQVNAAQKASADELFKKGDAMLDSGKLDEALKLLEEAVSVDKGHYDSYVSLGIVYAEMGMLEKAYETFTRAEHVQCQKQSSKHDFWAQDK